MKIDDPRRRGYFHDEYIINEACSELLANPNANITIVSETPERAKEIQEEIVRRLKFWSGGAGGAIQRKPVQHGPKA